jgi:hypothetical protein
MPVKARHAKRRRSLTADLHAWEMLFTCGTDYFGDLGMSDAEALAAAPEAWRRLGAAFLATWQPETPRAVPWALQTYGEP